jgi:S-adenosylmethionine-diacylgycerolhomoserine-N-methlytransferase
MSLISDLRILYHLTLKPVRGKDHGQAAAYDDFRRRLLRGRQELWNAIHVPAQAVWVDMGGGTGSNIEYFGPRLEQLSRLYVVDLSHSLLDIAKQRIHQQGWSNVETVEADATIFQPANGPVDVVTFSYSLTMIPDWFSAIDNALTMLKPGGQIGVVDFYVSRKYPSDGLKRHGWFTRSFWPTWFAGDNVFPSSDHVPYLHRHFDPIHFEEHLARVPYLPLVRTPYYTFVGRKRG